MKQTKEQLMAEVREQNKLFDAAPDLLAALEALDKHYRSKITVHNTMLPDDHPLKLSAAAQAKAKGIKE